MNPITLRPPNLPVLYSFSQAHAEWKYEFLAHPGYLDVFHPRDRAVSSITTLEPFKKSSTVKLPEVSVPNEQLHFDLVVSQHGFR
jgi:hypothetical protein